MTVIHHEDAGDIRVLSDKIVGIIGYGNMGRPVALNLQDSGIKLQVAVNSQETQAQAIADGLPPLPIEQVVKNASILMLLLPDEVMPQVYLERISPHLTKAHTLIFASAYNVAFGYIEPPPFVDVGVVAPRTFGAAVRERYLSGQGFYSFVAVGTDASGHIWETILALAKAMGSLRAGAVEVTMQQEVELDLFMQQAILPAVHYILTAAAGLLFKRGYPPEAAMLDLYVSGELNDYLQRATEEGMLHALRLSSLTGQFGIFSRLDRFSETRLERLMEITLEEIRSQHFSREWAREYADGYPRLKKLLTQQEKLDLWELEQQTIELLRGL
jgi:ketol-acid reductoisomerase